MNVLVIIERSHELQTQNGPSFAEEPPGQLEFSNTIGGRANCLGADNLETIWHNKDGERLMDIPGLRKTLRNGTLVMLAFPASSLRPEVHDTVVYCSVSNSVGTIISRDVYIKAVIQYPRNLKVESFGSSVGCPSILRCKIADDNKEEIKVHSWLQEPSLTLYPTQQSESKQHHLPTGHLLINLLDLGDQYLQYRCRATTKLSHDVLTSEVTILHIKDKPQFSPPVFIEHSTTVTIQQDDTAILLCLVSACPAATITWTYLIDGVSQLIPEDERIDSIGYLLSIREVATSDSGTYRCHATNSGGEIKADIKLIVTTPLVVDVQPPTVSVPLGASTTFQCHISSSSSPSFKITWLKDGYLFPTVNGEYETAIHISSAKREDKGMYQCMVRASNGDTASGYSMLTLGDSPPSIIYAFIEQTVQPGPSISLKCSASGNPIPSFIWRLDGFEIYHSTRLTIGQYINDHGDVISHVNYTSTRIEDGGEYSCIASNKAGSVEHAARLNVYGPPYIREFPHVVAIAGATFLLKCPAGGYPLERVYWERANKELPDDLRHKVNEHGVLAITNIAKSDAGQYTCWVRSKQGDIATRSTELEVIAPPKLSPFQSTPMTLNVGERASLTCSVVHGDLPLDFGWRKDGKRLEPGEAIITQIDNFTSVLAIQSLEPKNSGEYSCSVQNRAMEVKQTRTIEVNVPPIIEPFHFQEGLAAGTRTRLICGVSGADLPLTLSWLKDGFPLSPHLAEISTVDPYSSLLSFPSLDARHSGRYTCVANNSGGAVSYSADLLVKVPPRWEIEPRDTSILRGRTATIDCKAYAVPTANTTWLIGIGGKSGDFIEILDRPNIRVLPNGTLVIHHALDDTQGFYLCQSQNGIGSGVGKVIRVKINSPPYFTKTANPVKVKRGDTAHLICFVSGDTPLTIRWYAGPNLVVQNKKYRIDVNQDLPQNMIKSELIITNVDGKDSGTYGCEGNNVFGSEKQMQKLVVQEPPNPPHSIQITEILGTSVRLDWQLNYIGDYNDLSKFIIEYREKKREWQKMEILTHPLNNYAYVKGLKPATSYTFRVMAVSTAGISSPSEEILALTEQQKPSGPPIHVIVKSSTSESIYIKWNPPYKEFRNGDITGYTIYISEASRPTVTSNYTVLADNNDVNLEYSVSGLAKYTKYLVRIQANNKIGSGPPSEPQTVQTLEDVPKGPATGLYCVSITPQSLHLYWVPPREDERNGRIAGYRVTYEPVVGDDLISYKDYKPVTLEAEQSSKVINGLHKYTNYSFHVVVYTSVGDGPTSAPVVCATDEDVPEAPADIKVVPTTSQSLNVLWLPPAENNGIITKYNLYTRIVERAVELDHRRLQLLHNMTSHIMNNIPLNVEHQFWITASTKTGEGKSSKVTSIILSGVVPPNILAFGLELIRPWRGSVTLSCPAVGFLKRRWLKNNEAILTPDSRQLHNGDLSLKLLQPHDAGNYTCEVENDTLSDYITYRLYVQGLPLPPTPHERSSSLNSVVIDWTHELRKGDAPIQEFTLAVWKAHAAIEKARLARFATTYEIKNLKCGTTYELVMTAINSIGESNMSNISYVKTLGKPPTPPATDIFIRPNSTFITLNFHTWEDNGCPLIDATTLIKSTKDKTWISEHRGLKKIEISELQPATKYILKAEVENEAGFTTFEFEFYTLTKMGEVTVIGFEETFEEIFNLEFKIFVTSSFVTILLIVFLVLLVKYICMKTDNNNENNIREDDEIPDPPFEPIPRSSLVGPNNSEFINMERVNYINPPPSKRFATILKPRPDTHHSRNCRDDLEKIPETSDDISPYATFQLLETGAPRRFCTQEIAHPQLHHFVPHIESHLRPVENPHSVMYHERLNVGQRKEKKEKLPYNRRFVNIESESEDDCSIAGSSNHNSIMLKPSKSYECIGNDPQLSSTSSDISACEQKTFPRKNHRIRKSTPGIAETRFGADPPKEVHRPEAVRVTPGPSTSHQVQKPSPRAKASKTQTDFSIAV